MGASYANLCVRSDALAELRELLVKWLDSKGFRLESNPPIFECDEENERCVFLVTNARWTTILYSSDRDENRLRYELAKLNQPILHVWVYNSDAWGYRIFEDRHVTDSFYSHPNCQIGDEEPGQPSHGDPRFLCETFELDENLATQVHRVMHSRALFKERLLDRFCRTIGMAASVAYRDLEEHWQGADVSEQSGDLKIERLFFVRDGSEPSAQLKLHAISVEKYVPQKRERAELPPELQAEVDARIRKLRMTMTLLRPIGWIARMVGAVLGFAFSFRARMGSQRSEPRAYRDSDLAALFPPQASGTIREGNSLTNRRLSAQITIPDDAVIQDTRGTRFPFQFSVEGLVVHCEVFRIGDEQRIRQLFVESDRNRITHDESFFVGEYPARVLWYETRAKEIIHAWICIIQTPRGVFQFAAHAPAKLNEVVHRQLRSIAESLRLV